MNYNAFESIVPSSSASDIAESGTAMISMLSKPAILLCAVFLAFIVLDLIINVVQKRHDQQAK